MLNALLSSIQTSLTSSGFLIGSVFPVVLFTVVNALLAARAFPAFKTWLGNFEQLSDKTVLFAAISAAILVGSYVLSAITPAVQEMFEGRRWPVSWFEDVLHAGQLARLRRLEARYQACVMGLVDITKALKGDDTAVPPQRPWIDQLNAARLEGRASIFAYRRPPTVDLVVRLRSAGREISATRLFAAMQALLPILRCNHATIEDGASPESRALDGDCDAVIEAIRFARDKYMAERIRLYNLRKVRFPTEADAGEEPSTILLAPTTLGNIARTMRSYAAQHYRLDLEVLWTRLDEALRSSEPFYANLQAAKMQVDFFIACAGLASLTTAAWLVLELVWLRSTVVFTTVGVVGPLAAYAAYALGCRAYIVFADVMRTGIDLFRFKVLSDLHLPLPLSLNDEHDVWLEVASVMGYENFRNATGGEIAVIYKHP